MSDRSALRVSSHRQVIPSSLPQYPPHGLEHPREMKSPSLEEKRTFFEELDALDCVSDGDDDIDEKEQNHRDRCRAFFNSRKKAATGPVNASAQHRRTASMPTPGAKTNTPASRVIEATPGVQNPAARRPTRTEQLLAGTTSFVAETPVPDTARALPASLRRSATLPIPASSMAAEQSPSATSAMRKRKRQSSSKPVPEAARILRGLSFYYIPNNDIAPARKLRIAKAQEYGARWVRNLADASHVIVDNHLTYRDIENVLDSAPAHNRVVVTEEYPIDCISFRTLLNADQNRYRVQGYSVSTEEQPSSKVQPDTSQNSARSLQVKAAQRSRRRDSDNGTLGNKPTRSQSITGDTKDGPRTDVSTDVAGALPVTSSQVVPASPPKTLVASTDGASLQPRRRSSTSDELSEYIQLIQQYKHLPLDEEDDDDNQSTNDAQEAVSDSDIEERSDDERAAKRTSSKVRRAAQKEIPFADRFACNRGGTKDKTADAQNPNARTIEILQSMCDYYARVNDTWRTLAYRKAIATLRRQPHRIATEEEAYRLPNIGRRLAAKIEEIVCTNRLRRLDYAADEPLDRVLETFLGVCDVGPSRARRWIAQGFRSLDDLLLRAELSANQRVGVERYADLNTRIPRAEIEALFAHVRRAAAGVDPEVELLVGGSYRRGAESSGDMDIVVTKKGTRSAGELVPFLEELVALLTREGFLVATLAALHGSRPGKDRPGSKWHGCCVLPQDDGGKDTAAVEGGGGGGETVKRPIWRRIDFLLVPESEYGAALIYFTGNDIFNRSMRLLASKKGMRLNQRGLYKEVMRGKNRVKVTEGELLEGRDERRIFELLGVKWREPHERWC